MHSESHHNRMADLAGLALTALLWLVLPLVYSSQLIETETTLRFLILGLSLFFVSGVFFVSSLWRPGKFRLPVVSPWYAIILIGFLIISAAGVYRSYNPGEAIYEWMKWPLLGALGWVLRYLFFANKNYFGQLSKAASVALLIFLVIAVFRYVARLQPGTTMLPLQINYLFASSLGNKNFFAETLVLLLPFCLRTIREPGFWKFLGWSALVLGGAFLLLLHCWSAWVAAVIMLLLFAAFQLKNNASTESRKRKWLMAGLVLIAVIIGGFIAINDHLVQQRYREMTTALTGGGINDAVKSNSTSERLVLWRNSLKIVAENKWTGCGAGNWKILFPKYGMATPLFTGNSTVRFVRPHNDYLLIAAEYGIPGLMAMLALLALPLFFARKLLVQPETEGDREAIVICVLVVVGYAIIALFSMPGDRFYTQVLLVTAISYLLHCYAGAKAQIFVNYRWRWMAAWLLMVVFCSLAWVRLTSEAHFIYALKASYKKQWTKMQVHLSAVNRFYFPLDFTGTPIELFQGEALAAQQQYDYAKFNYQLGLRKNPYHVQLLNDLGTCYDKEGNYEMAKHYYAKALAISPYFSTAYFNSVALEFNAGHIEAAYHALDRYPYKKQQKWQQFMDVVKKARQ